MTLRLGTRGSRLALAQSGTIADALRARGAQVEIVVIKTRGDVLRDTGLQDTIEKGFFTTELEQALVEERVDLVVHSLKDLPTETSPGTTVFTPARAPVGDVLVARRDAVDDRRPFPLAPGSRVGTGAARRMSLLVRADPTCPAVPIRGNVPTRVGKVVRREVDAAILARAGLVRLGFDLGDLVAFDLDPVAWTPAPGQGALGLQTRETGAAADLVATLHDAGVGAAVRAERAVLGAFEGGCHAAVGAWADPHGKWLRAGADPGDGWRSVAVPLHADNPAENAVAALRSADRDTGDLPWAAPAEPWPVGSA